MALVYINIAVDITTLFNSVSVKAESERERERERDVLPRC